MDTDPQEAKIIALATALDGLDLSDPKAVRELAQLIRWARDKYDSDRRRTERGRMWRSDIGKGIIMAVCSAIITIAVGALLKILPISK